MLVCCITHHCYATNNYNNSAFYNNKNYYKDIVLDTIKTKLNELYQSLDNSYQSLCENLLRYLRTGKWNKADFQKSNKDVLNQYNQVTKLLYNYRTNYYHNKWNNILNYYTIYYFSNINKYFKQREENINITEFLNSIKNNISEYNSYICKCTFAESLRSYSTSDNLRDNQNYAFINVQINGNKNFTITSDSETAPEKKQNFVTTFIGKISKNKDCAVLYSLLNNLQGIYHNKQLDYDQWLPIDDSIYSRVFDSETYMLIKLYDILLEKIETLNAIKDSSLEIDNNQLKTITIDIFTRYDMCQFCWVTWNQCIEELKKLFKKVYNDSKWKLKVNVYYATQYNDNKLLFKTIEREKHPSIFYDALKYATDGHYNLAKELNSTLSPTNNNELNCMARFQDLIMNSESKQQLAYIIQLANDIIQIGNKTNCNDKYEKQNHLCKDLQNILKNLQKLQTNSTKQKISIILSIFNTIIEALSPELNSVSDTSKLNANTTQYSLEQEQYTKSERSPFAYSEKIPYKLKLVITNNNSTNDSNIQNTIDNFTGTNLNISNQKMTNTIDGFTTKDSSDTDKIINNIIVTENDNITIKLDLLCQYLAEQVINIISSEFTINSNGNLIYISENNENKINGQQNNIINNKNQMLTDDDILKQTEDKRLTKLAKKMKEVFTKQ